MAEHGVDFLQNTGVRVEGDGGVSGWPEHSVMHCSSEGSVASFATV
jgi:hypothetical protein